FSNACCILCQNINFNGKEKWISCLKYLWITKCTYVSFPRETLQTYSTSRPNPKNIYASGCLGWMTFVRYKIPRHLLKALYNYSKNNKHLQWQSSMKS